MNKIFTQLVKKRGTSEEFLNPKYEKLLDPFLMPGMEDATARIAKAVEQDEKVLIYGDYDVDGVTAATVMEQALKLAGVRKISIMLPDRFIDGYGMSERLVERAKKIGAGLVVTVDCGSRNSEIVERLNAAGIDTVITDHHECLNDLPAAVAVVNAKRKDFAGPATLRELAGVGVAFKVAQALVKNGLIPAGQEKWLLDLVLIGTICDSMVLTGENRILCRFGMTVLEKTRRPGLLELLKRAGVREISAEAIGFQIGPRLNAAGRLKTAEISLNLLRTQSAAEAAELALKLEELNQKRRNEQRTAVKEISERGEPEEAVMIEVGKWHEGILGIVAGRLVETYHRPAFVLSEVEDGILKGSGRSFGDFSLAEALKEVEETIIGGGGHAAAAGVKLETRKLPEFKAKINEFYRSLGLKNQEQFLKETAELSVENLGDFSIELLDDLRRLEPFGNGNKEPIFRLSGMFILETRRMGQDGRHLRLDIQGRDGRKMKVVAFFPPEEWFTLDLDVPHDLLIKIVENAWQGTRSVEARLVEIEY